MTNQPVAILQHTHEDFHMGCVKRHVSYTAIIVGALVGIGLSFLLNLFAIAIGLSMVRTKEGMISLAIGGFIGLLIGAIVSMFVAGYAAGYLGRPFCIKRNLGVLYGFTTWCLALILTVLLTAHMGRYISTYSNFVVNPTSVVVTHNEEAPAADTSIQASSSEMTTVNIQTVTKSLGFSTFLIFVIFFMGAIASCFGGHYGMAGNEADYLKNRDE